MVATAPGREFLSFGPFRLTASERLLARDGVPVELGARALDILLTLVSSPNEVVSKKDLLSRVWPGVTVEESSLRFHMAGLRKALGDGKDGARYITTLAGRGYCFVAPVTRGDDAGAVSSPTVSFPHARLPARLPRMVGRDDTVQTLCAEILSKRFVSIVGPGGMGKTTVAIAVANALSEKFNGGVCFVDLGSLSEPALLLTTVATALGHAVAAQNPLAGLTAFLEEKRILLVLDSCEHLIEATSILAEHLCRHAPHLHILTTTREALRVEGENVHSLPPLQVPDYENSLTALEVRGSSAVQLFIERSSAAGLRSEFTEDELRRVAEICHRLDGIALAIELAASQASVHGISGIADLLAHRFNLQWPGRRLALARHQTLQATLDWSYTLLSSAERRILCSLSIFAGAFSLEAAQSVAAESDYEKVTVIDAIAGLVAKSLIQTSQLAGSTPYYRLLETTRAYALEKLRSGETYEGVAHRLLEYCLASLKHGEADSATMNQSEWRTKYGRHIDDVRASLDWAFGAGGNPDIGVALTVAALPLWVQLSLLSECQERAEQALAKLDPDVAATAPSRMRLSAALGWSLMYGVGRVREAGAAWATTLELADLLGDTNHRLRALWGLSIDQFNRGDFLLAMEFAKRFAAEAKKSKDVVDTVMANRLLATTLHYLGDQKAARHHIDQVIAALAGMATKSQIIRFQFDLRTSTHYFQARILWLQGLADQALQIVENNVEEGRALGHAMTYCSVLGQAACTITFLAGKSDAAERYCAALLEHTERHPIRPWRLWAQCLQGLLTYKRGEVAPGLAEMRRQLDEAGEARFLPRFSLLLGEFAAALGEIGEITQGLATVEESLTRSTEKHEQWYIPELLRIKGELLLRESSASSISAAERCFGDSIEMAQRQGALFWELGSSLSLARLKTNNKQSAEVCQILEPVCGKFTEGLWLTGLRDAKKILDHLPRKNGR